jgi:hypothetical protein
MKERKGKETKRDSYISFSTLKVVNNILSISFLIFTCVLLLVYKTDFLFRMQELSLFIFEKTFFLEFFKQPGGLLSYIGSFFTQFCYYPWLGVILLVALLYAFQYLIYKIFRINKSYYYLSFFSPALVLLFVTQLDYTVFTMKSQGILYSQLIGLIAVVGIFGLYKSVSSSLWRIVFLIVCIIGTYPLIGFYSLLAAFLIGFYGLIENKSWLLITVAVVLVASIPLVYYNWVYEEVDIAHIYFSGLPYMDFHDNNKMWYPLLLAFIFLFLYIIVSRYVPNINVKRPLLVLKIVIFSITLGAIYFFTYKDTNFHNQLKMERAIDQNNWEKALEVARKTKKPTYPIIMYRNIALLRTGKLCQTMFSYPNEVEPYNASPLPKSEPICAATVCFNFGSLNASYRWAMEMMIVYGLKVDYLKTMAKVAIYNEEPQLARKHLRILKKTLFYKDWAKKQEAYLNNPKLFKATPDYKIISGLWENNNLVWDYSKKTKMEISLVNYCAMLTPESNEIFELSMANIMVLKNKIPLFWSRLISHEKYAKGMPLPLHVQEAALLYYQLEESEDMRSFITHYMQIKNDSPVLKQFQRFIQMVNLYGTEANERTMAKYKKEFGNTYWYYYYFVKVR